MSLLDNEDFLDPDASPINTDSVTEYTVTITGVALLMTAGTITTTEFPLPLRGYRARRSRSRFIMER